MLKNTPILTLLAAALFVIAKACGMFGVLLGFIAAYRTISAGLIIAAFVSIGLSITFAIIQMVRERKDFKAEDVLKGKLRKLKRENNKLKEKLKDEKERIDNLGRLRSRRRYSS